LGELQTAMRGGDFVDAGAHYRKLIGLFSLNIWPGGSVRFIKAAMRILGLPGGNPRPPFLPLDTASVELLARELRALALPEHEGLIPAS
jgi:dihydrodipicolinate synthase/N-acetylneuraminate lyase